MFSGVSISIYSIDMMNAACYRKLMAWDSNLICNRKHMKCFAGMVSNVPMLFCYEIPPLELSRVIGFVGNKQI